MILLKILVIILLVLGLYYLLFIMPWILKYRLVDKIKPIKSEYKYVGYGNFIYKFFYQFPKQLAYDIVTRNRDEFRDFGFNIITGKQGCGKTITLVYLLQRYQKMYPKLTVSTNMYYKKQNYQISHWKDIVNYSNGIYGHIHVIDEVQNWFSCNQSKDFPVEMLREITQQRKQRKLILGTTQVFTRVSKPIRENVYMIYEPITLFGCITFVRKSEPVLDDNGTLVKSKPRGFFWFVHTSEIRDSFDTYQKILDMSESGFVEQTNINVNIDSLSK